MARLVSRSALLTLLVFVVLAVCGAAAGVAALVHDDGAPQASVVDQGRVLAVKRTDSSFDRFTYKSTAGVGQWLDQNLFRAVVYSPYFDDKTAWYSRVWDYRNLYGIRVGSKLARQHPDWILHDRSGRKLFLAWGCVNGSCPQYAGDVSNAAFRRHWIGEAAAELRHGYKGLWIDDVNLDLRISHGSGHAATAVAASGASMTAERWRQLVAAFTVQIRDAFPKAEIVHNAIWYAGGAARDQDPSVRAEVKAANWVNLERGVNDSGLTGGDGEWSLRAFLAHVDVVHQLGTAAIMEGGDDASAGREYNLAAYLLIASGTDAVGAGSAAPGSEWAPLHYDLGAAHGARTEWDGVIRRDFDRGLVLVNPPGGPAQTLSLGRTYLDTAGKPVTSVRLAAGSGAVLRAR
jgi:Hypothetical glycosyl hydrolase family 15